MSVPRILIIDDQRDVLKLLHSTLDTLQHEMEIIEAPSGEEALLEASRSKIDLLISDYRLPGMTGVELMHKVRTKYPDVRVILITGVSDKKSRDVILNAGAAAVFEKPISLTDFLDVVERLLGLDRTIMPDEEGIDIGHTQTLGNLLANFRQDIKAQAVYLLSDRGRVVARAGDLKDSSMEASLLSALMAIYSAGLKVSRYIRHRELENYHVFAGGEDNLLLIPVSDAYALLLAGKNLATADNILDTVGAMHAVRDEIEKTLKSMGVAATAHPEDQPSEEASEDEFQDDSIEALLKEKKKVTTDELNDYWNQAVEKQTGVPISPDVLTYDQARRLGLAPGEET